MAISYSKKVALMDLLNEQVNPQKSVLFLTTYNSKAALNSELNFSFRKSARNKGVMLKVIKNTLIKKSFDNIPDLVGPTYIAYMEDKSKSDEILTAKVVVDLVKKDFQENFAIIGSVVNGEFYNSPKTIQLSNTSSKEESLSQIAGLLNRITAKVAIGIKEVPSSIARGVLAHSKNL
jgi:large subunit ribosomal protein L10